MIADHVEQKLPQEVLVDELAEVLDQDDAEKFVKALYKDLLEK